MPSIIAIDSSTSTPHHITSHHTNKYYGHFRMFSNFISVLFMNIQYLYRVYLVKRESMYIKDTQNFIVSILSEITSNIYPGHIFFSTNKHTYTRCYHLITYYQKVNAYEHSQIVSRYFGFRMDAFSHGMRDRNILPNYFTNTSNCHGIFTSNWYLLLLIKWPINCLT